MAVSWLRTIPAAIVLSAALVAAPASAQSRFEVSAGTSWTRDNERTQVVSAAWLPEWRPWYRGTLSWELGVIHVRGRSGVERLDLADDVTVGHAGLRYDHASNGFTAGFGIGVQHGYTDALSEDPQFVSTVGWRWQRFSLLARHISNASLHQPNDGETMVLAAWRF